MITFARLAVAGMLSAVAVAALTWAGWPRPRLVLPFETGEDFVFADKADEADEDAAYRVIRHRNGTAGPAAFWLLSPEGNLHGPWAAGRCNYPLGFDGRGRLLASTTPPGVWGHTPADGYQLARYDPATGDAEVLVTVAADAPDAADGLWRAPRAARLSADQAALVALATAETRRPAAPPVDPDVTGVVTSHGDRFLCVCRNPTLYRVTEADGTPVGADWQSLPGRFAASEYLVTEPRRGRVVVHRDNDQRVEELPDWVAWLTRRAGRAGGPAPTRCHYLYHDWLSGEFRPLSGTGAGPQTHAVGPYGLAILTPSPAGGSLALWDLPPRETPWPWSVPAGVALGGLLTAAGVRLRRRAGGVAGRSGTA